MLSVRATLAVLLMLSACAVEDAHTAHLAQHRLLGLSEVDLEACLGAPDQHSSFGSTDVLTWYAASSSSLSYSVPFVGGLGFSNGGYCHATVRVDDGRVTRVLYSGEKNATLAPDAYCAPILRTCLAFLDTHPVPTHDRSTATTGPGIPSEPSAVGTTQPGATSAAPQPGASTAGFAPSMPTATPSAH